MDYKDLPLYDRLTAMGYTPEQIVAAYTAYGEARGEGARGQQAVVDIIANRAALGKAGIVTWWGTDVIDAALKVTTRGSRKTWQFDCWRPGTPNYRGMLRAKLSNPQFQESLRVAKGVLSGEYEDITGGATNYLNPDPQFYKNGVLPKWYSNNLHRITAEVGEHDFLRLGKYDPREFRPTGSERGFTYYLKNNFVTSLFSMGYNSLFGEEEEEKPARSRQYAELPEIGPLPKERPSEHQRQEPETLRLYLLTKALDFLEYTGAYDAILGDSKDDIVEDALQTSQRTENPDDPKLNDSFQQALAYKATDEDISPSPADNKRPGFIKRIFNFFNSNDGESSDHTFKRGETVSKIALRSGVARENLAAYFNNFELLNPQTPSADIVLANSTYKLPSTRFVSGLMA